MFEQNQLPVVINFVTQSSKFDRAGTRFAASLMSFQFSVIDIGDAVECVPARAEFSFTGSLAH
jgi:hypothetical protein